MTNLILTAYCSCRLCCGLHADGITASGTVPGEGRTCAGPFPFGTILYIEGIGHRVVEDRMARRYRRGPYLDIYFASHTNAVLFGRRTNTITIIKP